ncbi:MAG: hypothetical protein HOQ05_05560 [Corynebacteriales bacterium]|nr:hypothetical protein [Mycobacteriales bacterium]
MHPHAQPEPAEAPTLDHTPRLERGKKHTALAQERMWPDFGKTITAGASAAQSSQGLPVQQQLASWQRARDEAMKSYLAEPVTKSKDARGLGKSKDVAAAQVAFAVGWVSGSEDGELLAQLRELPEISFGMSPDLQSIASAESLLSIFPPRWHTMLTDERVLTREISPTRWAIELLPEVNPAASFTGVQRWKKGLPGLNKAIAEVLEQSQPNVAARFYMDNAREPVDSKSRTQSLDHVSTAAQSSYPPILVDGTPAETPERQTAALVLPAGLSRMEIESAARLAHASAQAPAHVTVFVPDDLKKSGKRRRADSADVNHESPLARDASLTSHTYREIVGQVFGTNPQMSTQAPDEEHIASWLPGPTAEPRPHRDQPVESIELAGQKSPDITVSQEINSAEGSQVLSAASEPTQHQPAEVESQEPSSEELAFLARLDRAKTHALLVEETLPTALLNWVDVGREAAIEMAGADPATAVRHYLSVVGHSVQKLQDDPDAVGCTEAELTAVIGIGWVRGSDSRSLLAQLRERPTLGLRAMPPDVQHLSRLFATSAQLTPAQVAHLSDERFVVRYARQGHFREVLPVGMPQKHRHEILDAQCPQRAGQVGKQGRDVDPDTYVSGLYFLGPNAIPATDRGNEIIGEYCDVVMRLYPPITAEGQQMLEAEQQHLVVKQRDELDPTELIKSAQLVMPQPTAVDVYTPTGTDDGPVEKWKNFKAPVAYRPIVPPAEAAPTPEKGPEPAHPAYPNGPTTNGLGTMYIYTPAGLRPGSSSPAIR